MGKINFKIKMHCISCTNNLECKQYQILEHSNTGIIENNNKTTMKTNHNEEIENANTIICRLVKDIELVGLKENGERLKRNLKNTRLL